MEGLPPTVDQDPLSTEEVLTGLKKMNSDKATGPDKIPIELFKHSKVCKALLVTLIKRIWLEEVVPAEFGEAKVVMVFKNKDSHDDPSKYRYLGIHHNGQTPSGSYYYLPGVYYTRTVVKCSRTGVITPKSYGSSVRELANSRTAYSRTGSIQTSTTCIHATV